MKMFECLDAAMFAASENYSLGVYELEECVETMLPEEVVRMQSANESMPLHAAA